MGKSLISQRRGHGGFVFRSQRKGVKAEYNSLEGFKEKPVMRAEVRELFKESGRNEILAKLLLENGKEAITIAAEGQFVGQNILLGDTQEVEIGNVTLLKNVPEGCPVFNIEREMGDGGRIVRATGSYALLVIKDLQKRTANIKLPSGKILNVPLTCRATIGCVAGGERKEKPLIKAGNKFHAMKAKTRKHITVRGVAMNAACHPFGGSQHHAGKSKSVSRGAPPGRKVGAIASSRTGRRKK